MRSGRPMTEPKDQPQNQSPVAMEFAVAFATEVYVPQIKSKSQATLTGKADGTAD